MGKKKKFFVCVGFAAGCCLMVFCLITYPFFFLSAVMGDRGGGKVTAAAITKG
jgi:hypothetical protein